ncbi:MAG: AAA family ATPase [bacterium]
MYYQYWGMKRAPFDNVPDPDLYWSQNSSLEDAVSEILFAIEEGNDCLAVMTGDIGTGKTMGLRVILNELNAEKYRVAFITNPDLSPMQLMREIIGQLQNKKVTTRYKDQLMEEFNAILFKCANEGQKAVIFIDEANAMSTEMLNQVRLMTNLQDDQQNMVIFILAGQKELGRRLESRTMENLFQRVGVYCRIRGLESPQEVQDYLTHRIQVCGGSPDIFTQDAYAAIWDHSQKGVPRLINKIAKLCLKAGETNQVRQIGAEMVHAVASMFEREKSSLTRQTQPEEEMDQPWQEKDQQAVSKADITPIEEQQVAAREPGKVKANEPGENVRELYLQQSPAPEPAPHLHLDPEMMRLIQGLPSQIRSQLQVMEDKQLNSLAGKMAFQCIQEKLPKNSTEDPVVVWDSIKGRIYSALKSLQEPREYCLA